MDTKTLSGHAGSETMKRIVKIKGVGTVAFPDSMSDPEVSQVAGRLYDGANPTPNVPQANDLKKLRDENTSNWRRIRTSDQKHYLIHPEDLPEA